jgi:ABC-type transport system involved in multi-copper enzyme maturation permease subunit
MPSKGLKNRRDEETPMTPGWQPPEEVAPSVIRSDVLSIPRVIGFAGLLLLAMGMAVLLLPYINQLFNRNWQARVGPGWALVFVFTGIGGLLFHAAGESDLQYRRLYGIFGFAWLMAGVLFSLLPVNNQVGSLFLPYGFCCFAFGLFFLLPFVRNETDPLWHDAAVRVLGAVGALMVLAAFAGGNVDRALLMTKGLPAALLGLAFLWAFVGLQGADSNRGYWTGMAIGAVGLVVFLVGLGRTLLPGLFYSWGWLEAKPAPYFMPEGLVQIGLGLFYMAFAAGICSDSQLLVLLRKEMASFFYSPIAYIIILGIAAIGWYMYWTFARRMILASEHLLQAEQFLIEPVVRHYVLDWAVFIVMIFAVPVITMRMFSEEKRTGTLEVLFTAPVQEYTVVLSKFLASFFIFMIGWFPWVLFLVAFRAEAAREFDYRPMISFFLSLAIAGAGFISMGLFFSSLTKNQIAAAILTFVVLMFMTLIFFVRAILADKDPESNWVVIFTNLSYIDLCIRSLEGIVVPRLLLIHLSAAIFWLFLTTKVLEARRWS